MLYLVLACSALSVLSAPLPHPDDQSAQSQVGQPAQLQGVHVQEISQNEHALTKAVISSGLGLAAGVGMMALTHRPIESKLGPWGSFLASSAVGTVTATATSSVLQAGMFREDKNAPKKALVTFQ